jgi:hypothetical protein
MVRVAGRKRLSPWRTFREIITTVPKERAALVRMPIQWLCDGSAQTIPPTTSDVTPRDTVVSTCPEGNTCAAGRCVPSERPIDTLPDYGPESVFGGAVDPNKGMCFDTLPCLITGALAAPDDACSVPKPSNVDRVNVGLRVTNDGICDSSGTTCFVPLDGNSREGWTLSERGDRLVLPEAACEKLQGGLVNAIYVSTACPTKMPGIPPCGPWSSVTSTPPPPDPTDAGSSPPRAEKVVSLSANDDDGLPCCPLMSDGQMLYTCTCNTTKDARVVAIDPARRTIDALRTLPAARAKSTDYIAAAILADTFFWTDAAANTVRHTSLLGDAGAITTVQINGDFTPRTPLLVDSNAMFLLASGVNGSQGSAVQLIRIDRQTAEVRPFDTGGNYLRQQFAQDASNIYVVSDADVPPEGVPVRRRTSIVRLSKTDGTLAEVAAPFELNTPDKLLGGYVSVQTDSSGSNALYGIYQDAPAENGTLRTQVWRLDADSLESTALLDRIINHGRTTLWILGIVDRAVLLAATEATTSDAGEASLRSSSVLLIPAGGGAPRIVADFARDNPILGFQGVAYDADSVYWLNQSGDLYRLARAELQ